MVFGGDGGGSLMVWDCMGAGGVRCVRFIEGTKNKTMHIDILKDSHLPSLKILELERNDIFM